MRAPRRQRTGSAIVILAVSAVALFGMVALTVDVGLNYHQKARLQMAADQAALAAVIQLPDTAKAAAAAADLVTRNGASSSDVSVSRALPAGSASPNQYEVVLRKRAPTFFAAFLGVGEVSLSVRALAVTEGGGSSSAGTPTIFDYALYSARQLSPNGAVDEIRWQTNGSTVNGRIHGNGNLNIILSGNNFNGAVTLAGTATKSANDFFNGGLTSGTARVAPPALDLSSLASAARAAGTYYQYANLVWTQWDPATSSFRSASPPLGGVFSGSSIQFTGGAVSANGTYYFAGGGILFANSILAGNGVFVTDTTINVSADGLVSPSGTALAFIALSTSTSAIKIVGKNSTLNGAFWAPKGGFDINPTSLAIHGGLFADNFAVGFSGKNLTLTHDPKCTALMPRPRTSKKVYRLTE